MKKQNRQIAKQLKGMLKKSSISFDTLDLKSIKAGTGSAACDQCCMQHSGGNANSGNAN